MTDIETRESLEATEATVIDFPAPAAPVDLTKPAPAAPATLPVPAGHHLVLPHDPEGDRPWINPALRTREGKKERAKYLAKQARRRARKAAARQRTAHGVLPRARRGVRRTQQWAVGVEGLQARAALTLAQASLAEADRAARRAQVAIINRSQKRELAVAQQQQAAAAVQMALAARKRARGIVAGRAAIAYGPFLALDGVGYGLDGVWGFLGALVVNLGAAAFAGRKTELTEEQLEVVEAVEAAGGPVRFEGGMTPRMFEQMIREALTTELKVNLSSLRIDPYAWGFEVHVWLSNMTPENISKNLALLEACLPGVRTNSILLQQSASSRNYCVIRVPGKDAWQAVPDLPYRAPKSVVTSQLHAAQFGADMSGRPLALPMQRTNVNVVGASRSGKSTLLQGIADVLTATDDQIVIGIDLGSAGSGFGGLRKGMHAVITDAETASLALDWALDIGKGRPNLFDKLNMGKNWATSAKRPGIKVIVDEFPALVRESKKGYIDPESDSGRRIPWDLDGKLAELVITSAKSDVTVVIAGQGVTKEKIGANTWLTELPVQVMCACDSDDVIQILPSGAIAEGWRPDRLVPAMGDQINDAGVAYVVAGGAYCEPIPYRACVASDDELLRRGQERAAAGLVELDAESAAFSRIRLQDLDRADFVQAAGDPAEQVPALIAQIRQVFTGLGDPSGLQLAEIAAGLDGLEADSKRWSLTSGLFAGDTEEEREAARAEALGKAIKAVLAPTNRTWSTESYKRRGEKGTVRGYRLKDLRALVGEAPDGA